ncbi:MAG: 30S ribosomal protein S8 [Bacteroidetes bacterium]|nr:30S ribosomal protein S8 [Bacteroidota bacterium]
MVTDTIADYLTRIRNAQKSGHKIVDIPASRMRKKLTEILHDQGYILQYKYEDNVGPQGTIRIALKYNSGKPVMRELTRVSKPGLRKYCDVDTLPRVKNGLGIAILSTSKGVVTNKEAKDLRVGGEILCYIS